ncbi:MAG: plastocyanin/azurin family copper-binding protein [Methylophaga sp.]|nr:plastocyanin/azurin family copper-binding protein [Methylophaga sp.]
MRKSKAIISAVIIAAIAIFVVAVVSTVITGGSENYQQSSKAVPPVTATDPADSRQTKITEKSKASLADEAQAMENSATEEVIDTTTEMVDSAADSAVEGADALTEKTNEAIAAAEEAAAEGREQAEKLLEEAAQEAEKVVASDETAVDAASQTHIVTAQGLAYNPLVVKIAPGDTVSWTNMSTHNTESLEGLIPEGAEMWASQMSDNYSRTFTQQGIYIYKCTPHFGAGMGGAIIVGQPVNLQQIKSADAKGAAKRLVTKAVQAAESM